MQVLRRHRGTVSGRELAREAGVSLRTIRRDIATLQAMGADIDGEAGVGYILRPGFLLPPLSFTEEEIQALVAGAQWVSRQTDDALAHAVQNALAKINAVLSPDMRRSLDDNALYISRKKEDRSGLDLAQVRKAIKEQRKMRIVYAEQAEQGERANQADTEQTIWPIMLGFFESQRFIAAWCELRGHFYRFHAASIVTAEFLEDHYETPRQRLVKEWHAKADLPCNRQDGC
jgi:predicted DNA-binding transcriptional regulator YafY